MQNVEKEIRQLRALEYHISYLEKYLKKSICHEKHSRCL